MDAVRLLTAALWHYNWTAPVFTPTLALLHCWLITEIGLNCFWQLCNDFENICIDCCIDFTINFCRYNHNITTISALMKTGCTWAMLNNFVKALIKNTYLNLATGFAHISSWFCGAVAALTGSWHHTQVHHLPCKLNIVTATAAGNTHWFSL